MRNIAERIRHARAISSTSQSALAEGVGVQRGAVAQWERKDGSLPTMQHLIDIAIVTRVCLEWLGTGRGAVRPDSNEWTQALEATEYAQDDTESECLTSIRRMPLHLRNQVASILKVLAQNS